MRMKRLVGVLIGLSVMLLAPIAMATIVVNTDAHGNPASCGEIQGGNALNIGTPNPTVSVGDVLVLLLSGIGFNDTSALTDVSQPPGITAWTSAKAISSVLDGFGRSYVLIAKATAPFSNGVGVTVTTNPANTFVGGCMMDVGGLSGVFDQQTAVLSPSNPGAWNVTPTVYNRTANELALAISTCQNQLNLTTPIDPPWTSIGYNGVGGCPAGFLITSSIGSRNAILNQNAPGSAAVGTLLIK